jgi:predicted RNA-binding protein with RPS1 domain
MSDEMVQEKTETTVEAEPTNGLAEGLSGAVTASDPVSSEVAAPPAATDEPAPAQPVAASATAPQTPLSPNHEPPDHEAAEAHTPSPVIPHEASHGGATEEGAFEQAMAMDLGAQYDRRPMQEGDVITGTVMRVDREGVLVDVGAKSEGIIRIHELSRDANVNPENIVKVGDQIRVYVLEPENQDGNPILSKKRADFEQAWERVQQAKESGETLVAMVTDRVKGGLVVDLGIRGFVPASHVGNGSLKTNLDKYVGQSIPLKVIEVDKERRKVVLSNKQAAEEERRAKSEETKANLAPGQIRHGVVRRLTPYGAFIDLGGIDGLLHISEMSWTRINDPKEVLREGQELDVIILKMDLGQNRVSLGLRQILPDPWSEIAGRYKEGDIITGAVTRIVPFGAFVQVEGGVEGIIPNAEMPRNRGGRSGPGINQGEEVTVKVVGLRPEERKMTLSLRALQPPEEAPASPPAAPGAAPAAAAPREAPAGGGKRERRGRDGEERDDYNRYAPGRQEEPRFNQLGEAFAAAQRRERPKRDRRAAQEEEEYVGDIELDEETAEATEETTETDETNETGS